VSIKIRVFGGFSVSKSQFEIAEYEVRVESVPDIVKPKITKSALFVLILTLIELQSCNWAGAQVILQDGSLISITNDANVTSISQSFTVTQGASALVVLLFDQNDVAVDSGPVSMTWGAQPMVKAGGQFDPRGVYASSDIWYLYNPTPGTNLITATDTSTGTVTAMAMQVYTLNGVDTTTAPAFYGANGPYGTNGSVTLSDSTGAGDWAALNFSYGFNSTFDMSIQSTSGTTNFSQAISGDYDVIMGAVLDLALGATTISVGNAIGGGVPKALAAAVFTSAGINTNLITPQFSNLTGSMAVPYGSSSVPFSGTVSSTNGIYLAEGTVITVTINGNSQQTSIDDSTGDFTINYDASSLPVSAMPYPITYVSAPANSLLSATDSSTTLTINPLPLVFTGYLVANGTATVPAANLSVSNLVGSDNLTLSGSVTVAGTNAGPQAITSVRDLTLGGMAAANYTLTGAGGVITIIGTGGVQNPGSTNWIGVFRSAADIDGWANAGGNQTCALSFLAGDAPPWGPSSGALVVTASVPSGGIWTQFGKALNGTNLSQSAQLEFDIKVGTNQTVWDQFGTACSTLEPFVTYGNSFTPSGGPQPGIFPTAGNNGWQHMVIPAAVFGPTGNLNDVQQMVFSMVDGYFPTACTMVLEFANIEWDNAPVVSNPAIMLNPADVVRTADARWFGINAGSYDYDFNMQHTVPESQAAGWAIFRYPGGSESDGFNWENFTTSGQNNPFSNFAQVVTNLGDQAMITVNYGSGTPEEAAAWVAYANITNHLGFKYWEVGNEVYAWPTELDTNVPGHDPWLYGQRAAAYIQQMKAVDPTIKVGVVVVPGLELDPGTNSPHYATNLFTGQVFSGWTPVVMSQLRQAGVIPDFVIYHFYAENGVENDQTLLATANWAADAAELRGDINDFLGPPGTNVELLITENNSDAAVPGKQSVSVVNGLYYADSLGQIMQTEFNCRMWWQLHDGNAPYTSGDLDPSLYGWRLYGSWGAMDWDNGLELINRYPSFFAAELLAHFIRGGDKVVSAQSDLPLVSAYGALRTNGTAALLLINKSATNYYEAGIALTNWSPAETATVYSYGMPQDNAARNGNNNACDITTNTCKVSANFNYTLAPYSMNVFVFNQAPAAPSLSVSLSNPGQFVLQLTGEMNVPYVLQSSTDLYHWASVSTNTLSGGSALDITNSIGPGTSQQFWRAVRFGE
jgi:alpha-L-arabinofuranosidase